MFNRDAFSDRLRNLRKSRHMSQKDLASKIGVSFQTISMLETAERSPSIEAFTLIAELFGISADYLLGLSDDPKQH